MFPALSTFVAGWTDAVQFCLRLAEAMLPAWAVFAKECSRTPNDHRHTQKKTTLCCNVQLTVDYLHSTDVVKSPSIIFSPAFSPSTEGAARKPRRGPIRLAEAEYSAEESAERIGGGGAQIQTQLQVCQVGKGLSSHTMPLKGAMPSGCRCAQRSGQQRVRSRYGGSSGVRK